MAFYVVYIKEAHPEDGWARTDNRDEGIRVFDARTSDERVALAEACSLHLSIRMPVLVDEIGDAVASLYGGWPDRLYLIGRDGRIAFQGDKGPRGFRPEELGVAIERELAP